MQSSLQKPGVIPINNVGWNSQSRLFIQSLAIGEKHINSQTKWKRTLVSCAKTAEAINSTKSEASLERKPLQTAMFPNGFEALVLDVCDETQIIELKVKVGEFEMHLKRNIGVSKAPISNISPTTPPPVPTKPMVESAPANPPPSPPKSSPEKTNPFCKCSRREVTKVGSIGGFWYQYLCPSIISYGWFISKR